MKALLITAILALAPAFAQAGCGAIAYSPNTGAIGWTNNYYYVQDAQRVALNECFRFSGGDRACFVAVSECNSCAVVARDLNDPRRWSWGLGPNVNAAVTNAMVNCPGCKYDWTCN